MKCKNCGIELSPGLEEKLGLCPDCGFKVLITRDDTQNEEGFQPLFKPRYWVGGLLSFAGWITLIFGIISIISSVAMEMGAITVLMCIFATVGGSALWFGLCEIIRMLQNKAYNE